MNKLNPAAFAVALAVAAAPTVASASVIGFLGNFDVINDTGHEAHGFEIELEDLHIGDITDTFGGPGRGFPTGRGFDPATSVQRYGSPIISEYSNGSVFGVRVTYRGIFDGSTWDYGTPSGNFITPGDNCWSGGGVGYGPGTPCDHFGVGTSKNPTKTTYNWLLETATPGELTNGLVILPAPVWQVSPAPIAGDPPIVVAAIESPPAEQEDQFGEAIWVKVFTMEYEDEVDLEQLVADNALIEAIETEIEWQLLQTDPGNPEAGKLEAGYGAPVGPDAASVIRRYEFFAFSGDYNPEDHEAILAFGDSLPNCLDDPNCGYDADFPIEIGTYLGAQNAAANLNVQVVPVPPALLLFGTGVLGLLARRRRS